MIKALNNRPYGRAVVGLCAVGLLALMVAGLAWWQHTANDPEQAFWTMLDNSLSTSSVTRRITQTNQNGALEQVTRLSLGGQTYANSKTVVMQPTATGTDTVVTETLGTTKNDYARYVSIDTKQRTQSNQPLDFKSVLGIWGKTPEPSKGQPSEAQFLNGTILGVIPFAPLNHAERHRVMQTMRDKNVFEINYANVVHKSVNGRAALVYPAQVNASAYIEWRKVFEHELGLTQLESVNPADYASTPPEKIEITIDKLSHQLLNLNYVSEGRTEAYSGFGLQQNVKLPVSTVSISDLQQHLQSIQ